MSYRASYSYGHVPPADVFEAAFEAVCPEGHYSIRHGAGRTPDWAPASGDYTCAQLYAEVSRLAVLELSGEVETERMREGQEDSPGSWASSILETLSIEWI